MNHPSPTPRSEAPPLSTFLLVSDPQSGIPLEVFARFQANVLIEPSNELSMFKNFKNPIFIPAFWFETKMALPDNLVLQMWALTNLQTIFRVTGYTLFALGIGGLITIAIYYHVGIREVRKKGPVFVEEYASTSPIVSNPSTPSMTSMEGDEDNRDETPILTDR